jgi:hypothetical protein
MLRISKAATVAGENDLATILKTSEAVPRERFDLSNKILINQYQLLYGN